MEPTPNEIPAVPSASVSAHETFGVPRPFKLFIGFGTLLFAVSCAGSLALAIFPPIEENHAPWLMPLCAAVHALFAALCFSVWRMMDDTVELSERAIAWRRKHKPDVEMAWNALAAVDDYMQARCLKLRARDGRIIRVEYQFNDIQQLITLLERNLTHLETNQKRFGKQASFYVAHLFLLLFFGISAAWCGVSGIYMGTVILLLFTIPTLKALLMEPLWVEVEPECVLVRHLFRRHSIAFSDLRGARLEMTPHLLALALEERKTGNELQLTGFKRLFHLSALIRQRHERTLDVG